MTSDFEKRSPGSTENTGIPADFTAGGTRQGTSASGTTTGANQSGFGESMPSGGRLPNVDTAFGQRGTDSQSASQTTGTGGTGGIKDAAHREASSVKAEFGNAADTVRQGVAGLGDTAREKAYEGVEKGKSQITSSIGDFAAAVRKASDELGQRDQSMAAGLVREVANGLEQATGAIHGRSVQDLSRSVAAFARRQPTTFLIGAALAGVALGRFARASGEHASSGGQSFGSQRWNDDRSDRYGGDRGRYADDLAENDGGVSASGLTPGRSAASRPVAPPVSAGTVTPRHGAAPGSAGTTTTVTGSTSGARPDSLSTGSTASGSGTSGSGTSAPAEGPSGAVLGHGSGSFNPEGGRDVR